MPQVDTPGEIDTDREQLTSQEQDLLQASFQRGLEDTRALDTEVVREKLGEYSDEIMQAAEIARAQFDQKLGGLNPKGGRFAVSRIMSGYFGWNSWENLGSLSQGMNDWIDSSGTDNVTSGNTGFAGPQKVGDEAVHVVLGIGTYHDSPKISRFSYEINESPRTAVNTKYEFTETDVQVKWFDRPAILPENALFAARLYADNGGDDFPFLAGLSFIKHRGSQIVDPANMTDDTFNTSDNIVANGP